MAYDTELADRIREILAAERGVDEKRMFGGLAFLVHGNMAVAASREGGLMVRIAPEEADHLLQRDHVQPMVMGGREMRGWIRVSGAGVGDMRKLRSWVECGMTTARSLPAK